MSTNKEGTTFHITIEKHYPNGQKTTDFIGKAYHSKFQLKKALKRVRKIRPDAKSGRYVAYY